MKSRIAALLLASCVCTLTATAQNAAAPAGSKAGISSVAPPAHPCTEAQVRELLRLTHAIDIAHDAMKESLHSSRVTSGPYFTPGFWDDMEAAVLKIDFVPLAVPAYQKYLSEEDMAAAIDFYKTPAGRRILDSQPFVASAVSDAARQAGEQAGIEVGKKHADEIQRLMQQQQRPAQSSQPSIQVPSLSK